MGYYYSVVGRMARKHTQTNNMKNLPRSGRPRVTSDRDDMTLQRLVIQMQFAYLGYRLYFSFSKPSFGRRLHEAETGSRLTNGYCAMSLNLNLVVLNTMPKPSCCPPFRHPPTSYRACVYGWQRQTSSVKSNNRLPLKRSRDLCSLASHEPGFIGCNILVSPNPHPVVG
jgi:hypothetical protein